MAADFEPRPVGRFPAQVVPLQAFDLRHDERVESAFRDGGRVHDGAYGLVAERGAVHALARLRALRSPHVSERHAPLQSAAVLRAGDDLLAGIAALLEAYAAHQLEV